MLTMSGGQDIAASNNNEENTYTKLGIFVD